MKKCPDTELEFDAINGGGICLLGWSMLRFRTSEFYIKSLGISLRNYNLDEISSLRIYENTKILQVKELTINQRLK
jgi:hypothetical protein